MIADLRICAVGDSFVAGVGDPEHLGWVGRVVARSHQAGLPSTFYNLGVRRQTSADVSARWWTECEQRLPAEADNRVVFSLGVNDTTEEAGRTRVSPQESAAHLDRMLAAATEAGWRPLTIGPLPVDDAAHNQRSAALSDVFAEVCAKREVGYVGVFTAMAQHEIWLRQIRDGDGAHPAAEGYQALADVVWPQWTAWLAPAQPGFTVKFSRDRAPGAWLRRSRRWCARRCR